MLWGWLVVAARAAVRCFVASAGAGTRIERGVGHHEPERHVAATMLWRLTAMLLLAVAQPAASYFNLFLSQTEVRKLMGKSFLPILVRLIR